MFYFYVVSQTILGGKHRLAVRTCELLSITYAVVAVQVTFRLEEDAAIFAPVPGVADSIQMFSVDVSVVLLVRVAQVEAELAVNCLSRRIANVLTHHLLTFENVLTFRTADQTFHLVQVGLLMAKEITLSVALF
jgi:hypothetical protein